MAKRGRRPAGRPAGRAEAIPGQADRLKRLREAFGYPTAIGFAAYLGISNSVYGSYENGVPISWPNALKMIRKIPGLTLDWLYLGKPDGLPLELARRLGLFEPPGNGRT
jgi:transcriptional regulator with XRE-family HTH domain